MDHTVGNVRPLQYPFKDATTYPINTEFVKAYKQSNRKVTRGILVSILQDVKPARSGGNVTRCVA